MKIDVKDCDIPYTVVKRNRIELEKRKLKLIIYFTVEIFNS